MPSLSEFRRHVRQGIPLLLLPACTPAPGADTAPPPSPFTFAILTDLHVGEGMADHGTAGFDDSLGDSPHVPEKVAEAINKVNENAAAYDLRFAIVLGDLTDSGEHSELEQARALLDTLAIPYLPLLGNHDMWPYIWSNEVGGHVEANGPVGDGWLREVFADTFDAFSDTVAALNLASAPVAFPGLDLDSAFVNFAFDYQGAHLVALDFNTREHVGDGYPGIGGEGELHDFEGGTWPWFQERVASWPADDAPILLLAHHPLLLTNLMAFEEQELESMATLLQGAGVEERTTSFAGHWHVDQVAEGPAEIPVVITGAAKQTAAVRVVTVTPGAETAYDSLL